MTTEEQLRKLIELAQQRDQKHYEYLRFLLGLAAGTLAVLVGLHSGHEAVGRIADNAHRIGLAALALAIPAGCLALRAEAATAQRLTMAYHQQTKESCRDSERTVATAAPPRYAAPAAATFYSLLCLAALALAVYAVWR